MCMILSNRNGDKPVKQSMFEGFLEISKPPVFAIGEFVFSRRLKYMIRKWIDARDVLPVSSYCVYGKLLGL